MMIAEIASRTGGLPCKIKTRNPHPLKGAVLGSKGDQGRASFRRALAATSGAVLLAAAPGCVSVPQETAELSQFVGQRLVQIEASHERFVRAYFRLSRERVEEFLETRWVPEFLETFVVEADLAGELSAPGLTDAERGRITLDFATVALEQIRLQRRQLLDPLNRLEAEAVRELRAAYAELSQAQGTLTAFIQSTHGLTVEQDAVLRRLELLEARDRVLDDAARLSEEIVRLTERGEDVEEILRRLREELPGGDRD